MSVRQFSVLTLAIIIGFAAIIVFDWFSDRAVEHSNRKYISRLDSDLGAVNRNLVAVYDNISDVERWLRVQTGGDTLNTEQLLAAIAPQPPREVCEGLRALHRRAATRFNLADTVLIQNVQQERAHTAALLSAMLGCEHLLYPFGSQKSLVSRAAKAVRQSTPPAPCHRSQTTRTHREAGLT